MCSCVIFILQRFSSLFLHWKCKENHRMIAVIFGWMELYVEDCGNFTLRFPSHPSSGPVDEPPDQPKGECICGQKSMVHNVLFHHTHTVNSGVQWPLNYINPMNIVTYTGHYYQLLNGITHSNRITPWIKLPFRQLSKLVLISYIMCKRLHLFS